MPIVTRMQKHDINSNTKDQEQKEEIIDLGILVNNNKNIHANNN